MSSAMFLQMVIHHASIDSMLSHVSLRFHTLSIVSCTMSSASSLMPTMRSATRKSMSFSGSMCCRKVICMGSYNNIDVCGGRKLQLTVENVRREGLEELD